MLQDKTSLRNMNTKDLKVGSTISASIGMAPINK
jgi:hypothetical protein